MSSRVSRIAITGVGMLTTVGYGAVTAAAAIRAGISRAVPLKLEYFDPEELGDAPVLGHVLSGISDGFEGVALLGKLASQAILDLVLGSGLDRTDVAFWSRTGLFIGASPYRSEDEPFVTEILEETLARRVASGARLPIPQTNCRVFLSEHISALEAAAEAQREIDRGRFDRVVVACADSLVKRTDLQWFSARGRLKTPDRPIGFVPGEGSAAMLLEAEASVRQRKARADAWLEKVAVGVALENDASSCGQEWAETIRRCLGARKPVGSIYADLNGEGERAAQWGTMLASLGSTDVSALTLRLIAASLGDTGAASGALALAVAARSLVRDSAGGPLCLVCARNDSGRVAAALIAQDDKRAPNPDRAQLPRRG